MWLNIVKLVDSLMVTYTVHFFLLLEPRAIYGNHAATPTYPQNITIK